MVSSAPSRTPEDVADTGWSIRDEYTRRLANGAWAHHSSKSLLIAVKGPIPSSDAALADADATAAGFQVDQAPGANVVKVVVTAEDGSTTETYAVTVARGTTVDLEVPADWSLKPDAVGAGGRFRLPFVSSTVRTPDSTESPTTTPTCRRPPQRATPTSSPSRTSSGRSAAPRTSTSGSRTDPREDDLHHSKASPCRRGRTGRAFGAVVCVVMLGLAFPAAARAPTGDERTALEALYDATDGDNWKKKRRWKSDQNGSWHGVTVRAGNVRKLELAGNKLNGSIPEGIFADLPYLEVVNLADNVLSGAIPADVADLSSLMTLDLSRNGLTGSIPSELGGLSNLTTLNLSRNGLTGSIPTVLGNASSLANLNLAGNGLTGSIPTELGDLPNLIDLRVNDNSLSGTIPTEFTESGDLRELHAQNTGITLPDDADFLTWAAGENRAVTVGTRTASRILELEAPDAGTVGLPIGVWSDGKTIWVAEYGTRNVLAYRLATGARNADKDIRLNINNDEPTGLWSDGTTMWVGDFTWLKLFAYRLSDGTYLPEESVSVDTYGQGLAMWSDGDTWWIGVNSKHTGVRGFEAYSDTRRPEADFPLASTNTYHIGMVSDGTTMWVVDTLDERLYAYSTEDGTHQPFGYQVLDPRNSHPRGAWSDGTTLYVVDSLDRVLYGYSPDATLSALALADGADNAVDLNPAFAPDETAYEAEVVGDRITVLATADDVAATVEYVDANGAAIADQDPVAQGHQMNLVAGANVVRVRVGSADGFASKTYAVSVTSTRPELVTNLGETLDDDRAQFGRSAALHHRQQSVPAPLGDHSAGCPRIEHEQRRYPPDRLVRERRRTGHEDRPADVADAAGIRPEHLRREGRPRLPEPRHGLFLRGEPRARGRRSNSSEVDANHVGDVGLRLAHRGHRSPQRRGFAHLVGRGGRGPEYAGVRRRTARMRRRPRRPHRGLVEHVDRRSHPAPAGPTSIPTDSVETGTPAPCRRTTSTSVRRRAWR